MIKSCCMYLLNDTMVFYFKSVLLLIGIIFSLKFQFNIIFDYFNFVINVAKVSTVVFFTVCCI